MKIELEIPDELVKREGGGEYNLHLFAGMFHIAVKRPGRKWVIKDNECSMCGSCCKGSHIEGMNLPVKDGKCVFLKPLKDDSEKLVCAWAFNRPFSCCIGSPRFEPNCTVTWKEVK